MLNEIKTVQDTADELYSANQLETALDAMAYSINKDLSASDLLVLCVLNGGIITAGKLIPRLIFPLTLDSINASRYQNKTSGGSIEWLLEPKTPLTGRTILLIDDILDEGITLAAIKAYCLDHGAAQVYTAVLLDKSIGKVKPITADYVGLPVENRYIFGYGLDYKGYLRNAPGIYACKDL